MRVGTGKEPVKGRIVESDMQDVGRFLNRLLGIRPEIQNRYGWCIWSNLTFQVATIINNSRCLWYCRLFELFVSILDLLVQTARVEGHLDSGIVDMKANTIKLQGAPKVTILLSWISGLYIITSSNIHICQTVHVDNMSGASTVLFTFTLDRGMTWEVFLFSFFLIWRENELVSKSSWLCVHFYFHKGCFLTAGGKAKGWH